MGGLFKVKLDYTYQSVPCSQSFWYFNGGVTPTFSMANDIFNAFEAQILAAIVLGTTDVTIFQSLTLNIHQQSANRQRILSSVEGAITTTLTNRMPPAIVANCAKSVGDTVLLDSFGVYTGGRPINRGRWYQSGLPLDLMDGDGINGSSANYPAFVALMDQAADDLTGIAGVTWTPVVFGAALPAVLPSPSYPAGKPARPFVVAAITGATFVEWTKIDQRDPT